MITGTLKFLFKKQGNKWVQQGSGITHGKIAVIMPGTYRTITKTNDWWGKPSGEVEVTEEMVAGAFKNHVFGVCL